MQPLPSKTGLLERLDRKVRHNLPTAWSHFGNLSEVLARRIQLAGPPILLLSLPRSGSSWVGSVLGAAPNALYLREPISQARRASGEKYTLVDVDATSPSALVKKVSDQAFAGLPVFPRGVIADAQQWQIRRRSQRRVIIKEVNPLACSFWLRHYHPRVVFLIRHPAAVALSYRKLGWLNNPDVQMAHDDPTRTMWEKVGMRQGFIHQYVLDTLRAYPDSMFLSYEALCQNPVETFRLLFAFVDLSWSEDVQQMILTQSAGGDRSLPYNTYRHSETLASAWKGQLELNQLGDLRKGYARYKLPWYNTDQDW